MIRIIYEDEELDAIRKKLKTMSMKQLVMLEDIIQREKQYRQQESLEEWLNILNTYVNENTPKQL